MYKQSKLRADTACSPHAALLALAAMLPQVPDCAEVCQHYLEDCSMDWPVALTLVHLQHKHQQEQEQLRQQQQQQHQGSGTLHKASSGPGSASVSGRRSGQQQRSSLHSRHSMSAGLKGRGVAGGGGLDAVTPLLPVPSESVYLQVMWDGWLAGWLGGGHGGCARGDVHGLHGQCTCCLFSERIRQLLQTDGPCFLPTT
jgi:hypothetical protein